MESWLQGVVENGTDVSIPVLVLRLVLAFIFGMIVAGIYRWTHRRDEFPAQSFMATLVLMTIVIAMSTQVIGNNVARAFSLVGALSIVRFRTVVQDTRDTAFVIFTVVVGMAIGAGHLNVAIVGSIVTCVAAYVMQTRSSSRGVAELSFILAVNLGLGLKPELLLTTVFEKYFEGSQLFGTSMAKQGNAMEYIYHIRLRSLEMQSELIRDLSQIDGVMKVELRRPN